MVEVAGVGIRGSGAKWVKSLASMLIVDRTLMVFSAWSWSCPSLWSLTFSKQTWPCRALLARYLLFVVCACMPCWRRVGLECLRVAFALQSLVIEPVLIQTCWFEQSNIDAWFLKWIPTLCRCFVMFISPSLPPIPNKQVDKNFSPFQDCRIKKAWNSWISFVASVFKEDQQLWLWSVKILPSPTSPIMEYGKTDTWNGINSIIYF